MSGESKKCLHVLANVGRYLDLYFGTLRDECDTVKRQVSTAFSQSECNNEGNAMRGLATKAQSCPPRAHRTWHNLFRKTYRRSTTTALQVKGTASESV